MFRVYQVKFFACDRRYRGQIVCGPNHHHHFNTIACNPCQPHLSLPPSVPCAPSTTNSYQSYVETAQQLDAVCVRKSVSKLQMATGASPGDMKRNKQDAEDITETNTTSNTGSNESDESGDGVGTDGVDGAKTGEGESGGSTDVKDLAEGELKGVEDKGTTWIDWAWPGSHTPCPFNSRHPADQISTRAHRLPFLGGLGSGVLGYCPALQRLALQATQIPCCVKFRRTVRILTYRLKAAVRGPGMTSTAVDVKELSTAYYFVADMPGLKNTDLKVQVENDRVLKISGERKPDELPSDEEVKYVRVERSAGKFVRKFNLPANANLDNITAACQDGLLTIIVPKHPPPDVHRPRTFDVPVSSTNLQSELRS